MPIDDTTTIDISKEDLKFSAAHFTIFSATERERLHGHNFRVALSVTAKVGDNGLCFSYDQIKKRLRALCASLDEYTLIPAHSPHLTVDEEGDYHRLTFDRDVMYILKKDALVLPVRNSTVEEYARYLLTALLSEDAFFAANGIVAMTMKVSSGPGQWGSASWCAD